MIPSDVSVDVLEVGGARSLHLDCDVVAKEFRGGETIVLVGQSETGQRITVHVAFRVLADVPSPETWDKRRATLVLVR